MELKAPLAQIKTALEVSRFTASSGSPALFGVHIEVKGKSAQFTGYNGEQAGRTTAALSSGVDGEGLLPRSAVEYINALSDSADLHLTFTADSVKIVSGKVSATMRVESPSNYPKVPFATSAGVEIAAAKLRNGLKEVRAAAASATSNRPGLAGVLFDTVDGELRLVTTDSYRLAISTLAGSPFENGTQITVPIRAVAELDRVLSRADKVTMKVSPNNVSFETDSMKLSSHLIAAKFPAYGQIVPANKAPSSMTASSDEILEAIKRLKIVAPRENRSVKVSCQDGVVSISTVVTTGDTAVEPLAASTSGDLPSFGVNVDYLADAVQALGSETVKLSVHDPLKPLLLTRPGDEDGKQVMMPIRI